MPGLGTIVNVAAIVAAGILGMLLKNILSQTVQDQLITARAAETAARAVLSFHSCEAGFSMMIFPSCMEIRTLLSSICSCSSNSRGI